MAITANRYLTLFVLLAAAAVSYTIGFTVGFWLLICAGIVVELSFWALFIFGPRRR
jgi:hypothetical protein